MELRGADLVYIYFTLYPWRNEPRKASFAVCHTSDTHKEPLESDCTCRADHGTIYTLYGGLANGLVGGVVGGSGGGVVGGIGGSSGGVSGGIGGMDGGGCTGGG